MSYLTIEPLSQAIYNIAKKKKINNIILRFQGGSDEGNLDIELEDENGNTYSNWDMNVDSLIKEIENWAWNVYSYSGAGEGIDYGDTITYDLENNKVHYYEWYYSKQEEQHPSIQLKTISENESKN